MIFQKSRGGLLFSQHIKTAAAGRNYQTVRMKISYNWLLELIDLKQSPEEIAALLTGCGLEVESIEPYSSIKGGLEGIVVGEVKTCMKHPNADKLSVTTVNLGGENDVQIVCGAPNVAAGQKVLVATVGSTVYPTKGEPFKISKSKIRGEVSEGMICAEDELGLGESHDGILILPADYVVGKKASEYFPIYTDYLIEIGLTANRGDAASHLGVARDLRALTNFGLRNEHPDSYRDGLKKSAIDNPKSEINVSIEDADCPRYSGISISGITVKESPDWIKNKLKVIGLAPINNIVDATNYVLHELGQPLHAFDADKIAGGKIIVKKATAGTPFTTLDKTERKLNGTECMICDAEKPLAIAGVFGGLHSGISADTKNIFIESAYFDAASVRKTARFHGLNTDASFRYERGTDPNMTVNALKHVVQIITKIAGGEVSSEIMDVYPAPIANTELRFSIPKFYRLLGQEIPLADMKRILTGLDIEIKQEETDALHLSIPPYRPDVKREADVAEEILRIYGLNNIEIPTQVRSSISASPDEGNYKLRNRVADYLSNNGFYELTCNSLTKSAYYTEEELAKAVKILNPLSNDLDIMRMSMLYSGLEMLQYNSNRRASDIKCFEYGFTYTTENGKYVEVPHISVFITGMKQGESWNQPQQAANYYTLKSTVSNILSRLGINEGVEADYTAEVSHLYNTTTLSANGKQLVTFGTVNPDLAAKFDLGQPVHTADFHWSNVLEASLKGKFQIKPVSAFPQVRRDLALLIDNATSYADIERIALKAEPKLLKAINAFDVYQGDKIEQGKKSYAVSFILQDEEKTLTDQDIDRVMSKLVKQFEKELNATLRS
jgi:phenylalanyl-tRNA synthetase beta chain